MEYVQLVCAHKVHTPPVSIVRTLSFIQTGSKVLGETSERPKAIARIDVCGRRLGYCCRLILCGGLGGTDSSPHVNYSNRSECSMPPAAASATYQPMLRSVVQPESTTRSPTRTDAMKSASFLPMQSEKNPQRRGLGPTPVMPEAGFGVNRPSPTTPIPIPKPSTYSATHRSYHHGSAGAVMMTNRGNPLAVPGAKNIDNHHAADPLEDCFAPRNTWPRNGGTRARRAVVNPPERSPLSIYGDGALHSFTVCGAPGCQVCSNDASGHQHAAFFLGGDRAARRNHGHSLERRERRMIQYACANCRMPYIPKAEPEDELRHTARHDSSAERRWGGDGVSDAMPAGEGDDVVHQSHMAGRAEAPRGPRGIERGSQQSQLANSASASNAEGELHSHQPGFCSGECRLSYMLTNPNARRRQRAAAAAKAAARAAMAEGDGQRRSKADVQRKSRPLLPNARAPLAEDGGRVAPARD